MSHQIYTGIVEVQNLGSEFDTSANPIVLKLDPTISKTGSGALKANVTAALTGTNLSMNGGPALDLLPAIKAGETLTTIGYDPATKTIAYKAENGATTSLDLSALATDIYITGSTYNAATMVLTLTDNSATTPDITLNLADLKKVATTNSASVSFSGTGETATPLSATVTAIPAGVTISPTQLTPGTFPAGVITPAANVGPGALPAATTIAPSQITAGALPAAVTVPGGNITGTITPSVMTASTVHTAAWTKGGGIARSVNAVAANLVIPTAVLADVLGYDAAGAPSWQTKTAFAGTLSIGASQLTPGTLPAGVILPASQLGPGAVPAGVTVPANQLSAGTVPAGVVVPASQLGAGAVPAGVTVPASQVTGQTNTLALTKAGGLVNTTNGVGATVAIPAGTATEVIGYNAAGTPVSQTVSSLPISPTQLTPGTFPAGVITPAANVGPGALPATTTIAPSQLTAGALPAGVTVSAASLPPTTNTLAYATTTGVLTSTVDGVVATTNIPQFFKPTGAGATAAYTVPNQSAAVGETVYHNLITISQASAIILPAIGSYPQRKELYLKTLGTWTGAVTVTPAGGQIDGLANFTFNKSAAALRPSITVMHDGTNWFVV